MARIENRKYTIEDAFKECFYIVPDYQREYVWTEREVQQLLQDIHETMDASAREYFIGTILVSPTEERDHFEVIDGQQRLTTLFLVLCALRQHLRGQRQHAQFSSLLSTSYTTGSGDLKTNLKLAPRYEHAEQLLDRIVATDADRETTLAAVRSADIPQFGSLDRLIAAYSAIHTFLEENYKDVETLKRYWGHLATNVVFIQISTDVSNALKIFETINERGVGLNPMDLLKNLLFTQVSSSEYNLIKDGWKKITAPLERNREKPLRFLRYYIMANYRVKNERKDGVVREDEIYDWLTDKNNALLCGYRTDPYAFIGKVTKNVERFVAFTNGKANDGTASAAMEDLQQLCGAAFSLHYVLLLAAGGFPKPLFDHFVRQLESFLFYIIFTKTPSRGLERDFSAWADELREIGEESDRELQKSRLNSFILDRLQTSMNGKEAELTDMLKRYTQTSMQQYRTRYLLAKLTRHVDMAFKGLKTPTSLRDYAKLEIEHILPAEPEDELRAEFTRANPGKLYDESKGRLGNLTLLEKPINIVAGNDFFAKKKALYKETANYLTRSISGLSKVGKNTSITRINKKLKAFDTWSAATIETRQDMLIDLVHDIWQTGRI